MARAATTELQQQIEVVRRDAFAAGYAAAMQAILDLASRPVPTAATIASVPSRRGRGRVRKATQAAQPTRRRRASAATRKGRSATRRQPRGTNALMIEQILKAAAPRALRPAEIRKALQDNGVTIPFASISHALGQLETRNAAEQVRDSKTWRYQEAQPEAHSKPRQ